MPIFGRTIQIIVEGSGRSEIQSSKHRGNILLYVDPLKVVPLHKWDCFIFENPILVKFGYSEKATKLEKIFHLKFDVTE